MLGRTRSTAVTAHKNIPKKKTGEIPQKRKFEPGKLLISPIFTPKIFWGNYWGGPRCERCSAHHHLMSLVLQWDVQLKWLMSSQQTQNLQLLLSWSDPECAWLLHRVKQQWLPHGWICLSSNSLKLSAHFPAEDPHLGYSQHHFPKKKCTCWRNNTCFEGANEPLLMVVNRVADEKQECWWGFSAHTASIRWICHWALLERWCAR